MRLVKDVGKTNVRPVLVKKKESSPVLQRTNQNRQAIFKFKYVFRLEANFPWAKGEQNSLTPKENKNLKFPLKRDQVVLLGTTTNL